jgi:hypothetical protein
MIEVMEIEVSKLDALKMVDVCGWEKVAWGREGTFYREKVAGGGPIAKKFQLKNCLSQKILWGQRR